jgi:hypothetical protein
MASAPAPLIPKSLLQLVNENDLPPAQLTDKLFPQQGPISGHNWAKAFPFQLMVVEPKGDGTYTLLRPSSGTTQTGTWQFTLPIPPESMSTNMPFAVSTSITQGGFIEEWNGAPIRMINLAGTTGVLFGRDLAPPLPPISFAESILGGTINAANNTANAFGELRNGRTFDVHTVDEGDFAPSGDLEKMTGYFQFRLLQAFFEAYAELKKTREGRQARLVFCAWKSESVYLVTPMMFDVRQSVPESMEYRYNLSFKALKRVRLSQGRADIALTYTPVQRDPGKLAKLLDKAEKARAVLQNAKKTIQAIGGDVQHTLFDPLRELTLFAKDALAIPLSVADLADSIIQDCKDAILDLKSTKSDAADFPTNMRNRLHQVTQSVRDTDNDITSLSAEISDDPGNGLVPSFDPNSRDAHPANNPFNNPSDAQDFFSNIKVGDLKLSPQVTGKIAQERDRVRKLNRNDFRQRRDSIAATATNYANALGVGSATFNRTYNITPPTSVPVDPPTDDDFSVMYALNNVIIEMNRLVVTTDNEPNTKLDAIAAIAGMASRSGIAFRMPRSKFAVPFQYGNTLEMMSAKYLGTPDRWHEIAALNGLQSPYVDEQGFALALLTNGGDNEILVSDALHLFVGQPVFLSSDIVTREQRRITKIDHLAIDQHLITVDGDLDLDRFTTAAHALLEAFLPNTVNSQQVIYIPSDTEPKDTHDFKSSSVPGVNYYDTLIAVGGIDLLLTQTNDLIITPDGDTKWAVGLQNIVQKVRLALTVRQGTLLHHPEYGLPLAVGTSIADLSASDIVKAATAMFAGDPTFNGVTAASLNITGPTAALGLAVSVSGTSQVIPISVSVPH